MDNCLWNRVFGVCQCLPPFRIAFYHAPIWQGQKKRKADQEQQVKRVAICMSLKCGTQNCTSQGRGTYHHGLELKTEALPVLDILSVYDSDLWCTCHFGLP